MTNETKQAAKTLETELTTVVNDSTVKVHVDLKADYTGLLRDDIFTVRFVGYNREAIKAAKVAATPVLTDTFSTWKLRHQRVRGHRMWNIHFSDGNVTGERAVGVVAEARH